VQFVRAVEHLAQGFYKYGMQPDVAGGQLPFARLPIPVNPKPEPITYADLRGIFESLVADLATAEGTLAPIGDDDVTLPIRLGWVRLDLDGDGKASESESLMKILGVLNRQVRAGTEGGDRSANPEFEVVFDRGDVAWLRGYCHLLMAMAEVYLAHDGQPLFDHSAHLFFPRPKTPFAFLKHDPDAMKGFSTATAGDVVAFIHMLRFPVKEPARMKAALGHLEAMIALSRESWKYYLAETDNRREWVPNPKQDTVMPNGKVTEEMVRAWSEFLDESEAILAGKTLVPFWRDAGGKGVNLRRVFTEPREMDPILWFQGTGAAPYLEDGRVTTPQVWSRLLRVFRGEFLGFALWFN